MFKRKRRKEKKTLESVPKKKGQDKDQSRHSKRMKKIMVKDGNDLLRDFFMKQER